MAMLNNQMVYHFRPIKIEATWRIHDSPTSLWDYPSISLQGGAPPAVISSFIIPI